MRCTQQGEHAGLRRYRKMAESSEEVGGKELEAVHLSQQVECSREALQRIGQEVGQLKEQHQNRAHVSTWPFLSSSGFSMGH